MLASDIKCTSEKLGPNIVELKWIRGHRASVEAPGFPGK